MSLDDFKKMITGDFKKMNNSKTPDFQKVDNENAGND